MSQSPGRFKLELTSGPSKARGGAPEVKAKGPRLGFRPAAAPQLGLSEKALQDLVEPPSQLLKLLFELEFASLELSKSQFVRRWPAGLVLNGAFEGFVPGIQFANTGFDRHGLRLHAVAGEVNTPGSEPSDHILLRSGGAADGR